MIVHHSNNRNFHIRRLNSSDLNHLHLYLQNLGEETRNRFGPHAFDAESIIDFYTLSTDHIGYIVQSIDDNEIIAYAVIKYGYLEGDYQRYLSYGKKPDNQFDVEFAPSVTDRWQGLGIGQKLFNFIMNELKTSEVKRIILWGGVQANNQKALQFYLKNGFEEVGQFLHNGKNIDMLLNV